MWEPKPHVVLFTAVLVLLASLSAAADELVRGVDQPSVTIDDVAAGPDGPAADGVAAPREAEDAADAVPAVPGGTASASPSDAPGSTASSDEPAAEGTEPSSPSGSASPGEPTPEPETVAWDDATLYAAAEDRRGISGDEITLCGHAALALGAAFDTSREDLNVYWEVLNDAGGVHGRTVDMTWEDDAYLADQAVQAASTCADKDPFMILGGIGFDQIPGVRTWAEANEELYLHHIAVAPTKTYDYSFSLSPTVELVGEQFGHHISAEHAASDVGVMYRTSDNWTPGADAGIAVLERNGVDVSQYPVSQNQGVYAQQLNQMKNVDGIDVVWLWENALTAAQIINQASEIDYHPTWVVFPFQTTIDILTDPGAHTIEGVAAWNSYAPGGYGGAHAEYRVDQEIAAFEAAYARYRPDTTPNDLLWQVWVGNKILHQMFQDCGRDCTRNRFAGMLLDGYRTQVDPGCQIDFADPRSFGGHHGGFRFFTQEMFRANGRHAFRTGAYCVPTLG